MLHSKSFSPFPLFRLSTFMICFWIKRKKKNSQINSLAYNSMVWFFGENQTPLMRNCMTAIPKNAQKLNSFQILKTGIKVQLDNVYKHTLKQWFPPTEPYGKDLWEFMSTFSNIKRITVSMISLYNPDLFLQLQSYI